MPQSFDLDTSVRSSAGFTSETSVTFVVARASTTHMDDQVMASLAHRFEEQRPRLRAVAYRMLGSMAEAEDAVQETWLRLIRSDVDAIDNLAGWLTTVISRISLNVLRAREVRNEIELDELRMPDPVVTSAAAVDPEQETLIADSVGIALLVVLNTLKPAERVAFVLHDIFAVPFAEIALLVDRSPEATRQLASRARRQVRRRAYEPDTDLTAQRTVVDAFFAAGRSGDFTALIALLDPDVELRADFGPGMRSVLRSADAVSARARMFAGRLREPRAATVNGMAGAVILEEGRTVSVMAFTINGGRIVSIDVLGDAERVSVLDIDVVIEGT